MNRKLNFGCVLVVLLGVCVGAFGDTKSGSISLKESKFGPPDDAPKIELGKVVKLVAQPYITDFFDSKVITAGPTVKNTCDKPMFYVFSIAFFDKDDQLLGCVSQTAFGKEGLKPGEETQLGSCMVNLPPEELAKVAKFQATFFESEHKM